MKRFLLSSFLALVSYCMYAIDPNGARVDFGASSPRPTQGNTERVSIRGVPPRKKAFRICVPFHPK